MLRLIKAELGHVCTPRFVLYLRLILSRALKEGANTSCQGIDPPAVRLYLDKVHSAVSCSPVKLPNWAVTAVLNVCVISSCRETFVQVLLSAWGRLKVGQRSFLYVQWGYDRSWWGLGVFICPQCSHVHHHRGPYQWGISHFNRCRFGIDSCFLQSSLKDGSISVWSSRMFVLN